MLWHLIESGLCIKVLHRNATWTNYSQEKFPCLKSLVVGIIRSLMLWGFFRRFPGCLLRFLKATLIQRWSTKFWWSYKRVTKGREGGRGEGDYWSYIEKKMTVSHFTDNKFGISRFTRKKKFLYDQLFLLWLRSTAEELPCSMSSPFSRFLFLVLWKENWVVCLEVEARHHLLLIINK